MEKEKQKGELVNVFKDINFNVTGKGDLDRRYNNGIENVKIVLNDNGLDRMSIEFTAPEIGKIISNSFKLNKNTNMSNFATS